MPRENFDFPEKYDFVCDATSYEHFALWKEYHERVNWVESGRSIMRTIGEVDGRPIVMDLHPNKINGQIVLFYHGTSQLVDHKMMEDYVEKNLTNPGFSHTNAMNFGNLVADINRKNTKK